MTRYETGIRSHDPADTYAGRGIHVQPPTASTPGVYDFTAGVVPDPNTLPGPDARRERSKQGPSRGGMQALKDTVTWRRAILICAGVALALAAVWFLFY